MNNFVNWGASNYEYFFLFTFGNIFYKFGKMFCIIW